MKNKIIKLGIIGASGFVGRALVETLLSKKEIEITAIIHSPGNSWSILRHNVNIKLADTLNLESIEDALKDCTHVVNLSLGPFDKLEKGLKNIIQVCKKYQIKKLIHLSSITVYGDLPDATSEFEDGPVLASKGSYGWYKAKQDKLIEKANKDGLSAIVLCPPHITGAYGRIYHQIIDSFNNGTFALVENGQYPCNLVDVNNLCHAIKLSLYTEKTDGKRIFITNGDNYTWADLALQVSNYTGIDYNSIPRITKAQCLAMEEERISLINLIKLTLKLPELKNYVGKTILVKNRFIFKILKRILLIFKRKTQENKDSFNKTDMNNLPNMNIALCKQQIRGVRHKIKRADTILNYKPILNSNQSFKTFEDYYSKLFGYKSDYWDLIK